MPHSSEALSWLRSNKRKNAFGARHFKTTSEAAAAVERLYAAGATEVVAVIEYDEPERIKLLGDEYSDTLEVYGTADSESEIFKVIGMLKPYFVLYDSGRSHSDEEGDGAKNFWRIHWGMDEEHVFIPQSDQDKIPAPTLADVRNKLKSALSSAPPRPRDEGTKSRRTPK